MTETAWEAVGRLVKLRRERLHLDQDDLRLYGGPHVSTVGKCERAAQDRFPLRTQHKFENALNWKRGSIEEIISAVETNDWYADPDQRKDFENDLINANIPDLSHPTEPEAPVLSTQQLSDSDLLAELTYRMKRYASQDDSGGGQSELDGDVI
jgi:hypothetical protein